MDKKYNNLINKYADDPEKLNRIVVSIFIKSNHLSVSSGFLTTYVESDELVSDFFRVAVNFSIEDVINIFEQAIPKSEKISNGAVYTPYYIRDYIVKIALKSVKKPLDKCLCADIACGCGAFLYTLATYIHEHTDSNFVSIYHHLFGLDISSVSITRAKILLSLLALQNGEIVEEDDFNLICENALTFDFMTLPSVCGNGGFDVVVGNPPYVRSKHIDIETKLLLPRWETSRIGNVDLYIPFFEIGMSALCKDGILGYITVNSFFKSVNARSLRKYFYDAKYHFCIIDFGEQLVFKKKLAYTCLVFLSKESRDSLFYTKARLPEIINQQSFVYNQIKYENLDSHRGWNLNRSEVLSNIHLIENAGKALGDLYVIKNGIATLANDVFIFRPLRSDDKYYYLLRSGQEYPIERSICRDIIKPNILKTEEEIPEKNEKIITPYDDQCKVIMEDFFINKFPKAYAYLKDCREVLDARDKGEGEYGAWYAFGRNQAINDSGRKLLFPYMSDIPHFVYSPQKDMMIYCGYAIYHDSEFELLFLKRVLESAVFDYYIRNTSKPYSTGYYSYAKNYVKSFGLYPFSEEQKKHILSFKSKVEIDDYLKTIYKLSI